MKAATFHLTILDAEAQHFAGEVAMVNVPTTDGYVQLLYNHAPLQGVLGNGTVTYRLGGVVHTQAVEGGIVRMEDNRAWLFVAS